MIRRLQALADNLETGEEAYCPYYPGMPEAAELREVLKLNTAKSFKVWETINGMMIRREG